MYDKSREHKKESKKWLSKKYKQIKGKRSNDNQKVIRH